MAKAAVSQFSFNRGEIEAAQQGRLPRLITLTDLRGDLHAHTKATDGRNTLEEMARAAQERGYEYLAITNHSKRVSMAHGHDAKNLAAEMAALIALRARTLRGRARSGKDLLVIGQKAVNETKSAAKADADDPLNDVA